MGRELERILYETEDFLRRTLASAPRREARKRRAKRKFQEAMRRVKRAAFLFAGLLVALLAWSLVGEVGLLTWIMAIPIAMLVAFLSLFWGSSRREEPVADPAAASQALPLHELAIRAEEGLLDRCDALPGRALPAANAIMARLNELQPHLGNLDSSSLAAGDARRLIGQHLPRLVDTYLELPDRERAPGSESSKRLAESLGIVADELDTLLETCCRDRQISFDTQRRFIETRYKDAGPNGD